MASGYQVAADVGSTAGRPSKPSLPEVSGQGPPGAQSELLEARHGRCAPAAHRQRHRREVAARVAAGDAGQV